VVKTEKRTIDVVSHELTHVVLNTESHGNDFQEKWDELKELITQKMEND
jgi:hypothetical protein